MWYLEILYHVVITTGLNKPAKNPVLQVDHNHLMSPLHFCIQLAFHLALLRILIGYPREIPWRVNICFTRKTLLPHKKTISDHSYIQENHQLRIAPSYRGAAPRGNTCRLLQVWRMLFLIIFTQLFTLHLSTDICSHCGHAGFQPAIQQLFSMMMQIT